MVTSRLLRCIGALKPRLARSPGAWTGDVITSGLPVGAAFHDFALPTLSGDVMALSQWWGRRILLIFVDPQCAFCRQMLPVLARLEPDPSDGRPLPLIISTGDANANRRMIATSGIRCRVLLQEDHELAQLSWVNGTPMGYLLDEQGRIARPLAVGARAVLELASCWPPGDTGVNAPRTRINDGFTRRQADPVPARAMRDGVPVGTAAPAFRLPRLDGGEVSLDELRGQRVLLIFSDPACPPCGELLPKLEAAHRRAPDRQVLIVSRGGALANRTLVAEHGLTIPIALQERWEISRAYGMLATPIAFLIDEAGTIAAPVAVGADDVLGLAGAPAAPAERAKEVEVT